MGELGRAESVVVTNSDTTLLGGGGNPEDVLLRQTLLKNQIDRTSSAYEKEKLQIRLANISGAKTIVTFRARTQTDLEQLKYLSTTAMSSIDSALKYGHVLGGGVMLLQAANKVAEGFAAEGVSYNHSASLKIILGSLQEPISVILRQNNSSLEEFRSIAGDDGLIGFNVLTKTFENFKTTGIIDSADLVAGAVEIAFSNAKNIVRTL